MKLKNLIPRYDYSKENSYITIYHQVKESQVKQINIDWFDYNLGDKVNWLLIRIYDHDNKKVRRYRNIKLENVNENIKFISLVG